MYVCMYEALNFNVKKLREVSAIAYSWTSKWAFPHVNFLRKNDDLSHGERRCNGTVAKECISAMLLSKNQKLDKIYKMDLYVKL